MSLLTSLFLSAIALQASGPSRAPEPLDLVVVETPSAAHLLRLRALASDVDPHQLPDAASQVRILSSDSEQARLRAAGFRLQVLQEDLTQFYASRAAAELSPNVFGSGTLGLGSGGSMGGFKTYAEIETLLVQLSVVHAGLISAPITIGTTHEGRAISAVRLSTTPGVSDPSKPTVWFDGLHHGREPMGAEALLRFLQHLASGYGSDPEITWLVDTREFLFIPCVNPDGYEFNRFLAPGGGGTWRKNKRQNLDGSLGVDLNRNYDWQWGPGWLGSSSNPGNSDYHGPSAFSEPEVQALRDFMAAELPAVAVSAHSYGNAWVFPWGYDALLTSDDATFRQWASLAAAPVGWDFGAVWEALYFANGSSLDWMYGQHGCMAFAVEIGSASDGFWPAPTRVDALFEQALVGFMTAARVAGAWVSVQDITWAEVSGDGDTYREPGETWELFVELQNAGLAAANGTLNLSASSPDLAPLPGAVGFQSSPQSTQTVGPLRFDISPAARTGTPLRLDLDLSWSGYTESTVLELMLGEPHQLLFDDMQSADFGWRRTLALSGSWERAVPSATAAQPGADHSGLAGGKCWVTGAKGGPPNAGDVDGLTRLTSPLFRAGGLANLELEYARWFSTSSSVGSGDELQVEVSSDAGASWTTLETIAASTGWELPSFDLEQHVPLTDQMQLRFTVQDAGGDDTVEALLDDLVLRTIGVMPTLGMWGRSGLGETLRWFLDHPAAPGANYRLLWSFSVGAPTSTPGIAGRLFLGGIPRTLVVGTSDAQGRALISSRIPSASSFKNLTIHMQMIADEGGPNAAYSNLLTFTIR